MVCLDKILFPNGEEADEDDLGAPDDYPVEATFVIHFELQLAKKCVPVGFIRRPILHFV